MRTIRLSIIFLLVLSCKFSGLFAQAPQKMSYQAVLRNSSSELVVNTAVGMRISIIQGSEAGTEVYVEVQKTNTNANGLITIAIGTGTIIKGSFTTINWGNGPYFIKTETDPYGGASYTITGFSQFMSVPYALFAANSGSSAGTAGKSAFETWKEQPGNSGKTETDFLAAMRGTDGASAFQVWKNLSGNTAKSEADFMDAIRGAAGKDGAAGEKGLDGARGLDGLPGIKGESVYDIWKKDPANAGKTEANFLLSITAVKGDKGDTGERGLDGARGLDGLPGVKGESVFDIWKKDPANAAKTETDFLDGIKAVKGDKGDTGERGLDGTRGLDGLPGLKGDAGDRGLDGAPGLDGLPGVKGESVYDIWLKDPANAGKTETDFLDGIKAVKGDKGDAGEKGEAGLAGKSAFDLWKEEPGNADKTMADYQASLVGQSGKTILNGTVDPLTELGKEGDFFINTQSLTFFGPKASDGSWPAGSLLKGTNGVGLDFKGSYADLAAYEAAGNLVELNKAYYNSTDKKSYIYTGSDWKIFAQDGTGGGSSGDLTFNVDRNITRALLPGVGTNMGAGKTVAQFLEDYFFPRLSASPPTAVLSGSTLDIPYSTWKSYAGFSTALNLSYNVTNKSKQDDTEDKNIASIRLLSGSTELATATVNNAVNPMTGSFTGVTFANPGGSKTADFTKTFQLEVKDEQPSTVLSNTLTATMRKAIRLTLSTPTISPADLVYEYSTADKPIKLSWTFSKNDETVTDISVAGVSTGAVTTVTKDVLFKSIANGGAESQSYKVAITGDIYGETSATSPTIKWASTLYRGTISSSIAPCESGFAIADNQLTTGNTLLGGTWKGDTGYDFVCDASGKYVFFAYPDDGATPVVEYYDATFKAWQAYPSNQLKSISKANFENPNGYKGKTYKLVFVCVEYKSATVKIRIN